MTLLLNNLSYVAAIAGISKVNQLANFCNSVPLCAAVEAVEAAEAAVGVGGADLFVFRSSEAVRSLLKPRGSAKEEIKEMRITNRKTFLILHLCRQNGAKIVSKSLLISRTIYKNIFYLSNISCSWSPRLLFFKIFPTFHV